MHVQRQRRSTLGGGGNVLHHLHPVFGDVDIMPSPRPCLFGTELVGLKMPLAPRAALRAAAAARGAAE